MRRGGGRAGAGGGGGSSSSRGGQQGRGSACVGTLAEMSRPGILPPSLRMTAAILLLFLFLTSAIPERLSAAHRAACNIGVDSGTRHHPRPEGIPGPWGSGLRNQHHPLLSLRGGSGMGYDRAGVVGDSSGGGGTTGIVYDAGFSGDWHDAVVLLVHGPNESAERLKRLTSDLKSALPWCKCSLFPPLPTALTKESGSKTARLAARLLDLAASQEGVNRSRVAIVGFGSGATVGLVAALSREHPLLGGIVAYGADFDISTQAGGLMGIGPPVMICSIGGGGADEARAADNTRRLQEFGCTVETRGYKSGAGEGGRLCRSAFSDLVSFISSTIPPPPHASLSSRAYSTSPMIRTPRTEDATISATPPMGTPMAPPSAARGNRGDGVSATPPMGTPMAPPSAARGNRGDGVSATPPMGTPMAPPSTLATPPIGTPANHPPSALGRSYGTGAYDSDADDVMMSPGDVQSVKKSLIFGGEEAGAGDGMHGEASEDVTDRGVYSSTSPAPHTIGSNAATPPLIANDPAANGQSPSLRPSWWDGYWETYTDQPRFLGKFLAGREASEFGPLSADDTEPGSHMFWVPGEVSFIDAVERGGNKQVIVREGARVGMPRPMVGPWSFKGSIFVDEGLKLEGEGPSMVRQEEPGCGGWDGGRPGGCVHAKWCVMDEARGGMRRLGFAWEAEKGEGMEDRDDGDGDHDDYDDDFDFEDDGAWRDEVEQESEDGELVPEVRDSDLEEVQCKYPQPCLRVLGEWDATDCEFRCSPGTVINVLEQGSISLKDCILGSASKTGAMCSNGLSVCGQGAAVVQRCTVEDADVTGVRFSDDSSGLVTKCLIRGNEIGLGILGSARARVDDCLIVDCASAPMACDSYPEDGACLEVRGTRFDDIPWGDHRRPQGGIIGENNAVMLEPFEGGSGKVGRRCPVVYLEGSDGLSLPPGGLGLKAGELWFPRSVTVGMERAIERAAGEGRDLAEECRRHLISLSGQDLVRELELDDGSQGLIATEQEGWLAKEVVNELGAGRMAEGWADEPDLYSGDEEEKLLRFWESQPISGQLQKAVLALLCLTKDARVLREEGKLLLMSLKQDLEGSDAGNEITVEGNAGDGDEGGALTGHADGALGVGVEGNAVYNGNEGRVEEMQVPGSLHDGHALSPQASHETDEGMEEDSGDANDNDVDAGNAHVADDWEGLEAGHQEEEEGVLPGIAGAEQAAADSTTSAGPEHGSHDLDATLEE